MIKINSPFGGEIIPPFPLSATTTCQYCGEKYEMTNFVMLGCEKCTEALHQLIKERRFMNEHQEKERNRYTTRYKAPKC